MNSLLKILAPTARKSLFQIREFAARSTGTSSDMMNDNVVRVILSEG